MLVFWFEIGSGMMFVFAIFRVLVWLTLKNANVARFGSTVFFC
jgi:hypothetical protein